MKEGKYVSVVKREERRYHKMSYSLVVILELNNGSEVQYKKIMMIDDE